MININNHEKYREKVGVYLYKSVTSNSTLIQYENLYALLATNWLFDAPRIGISGEFVRMIYDDYTGLKISLQQKNENIPLKFICIPPDGADELSYLFRIVSLFNCTTENSIFIYCSSINYKVLKTYSNDNLNFIIREENKQITSLTAGVIITFGSGALHFIKQNIPVIIVGLYGFGGLVTPENFQYMVLNGFMGRPGGSFDEMIPTAIFLEELSFIQKEENIQLIAEETKKIAGELPVIPLSATQKWIDQANELYVKIYDPYLRWTLKPKIASNINMIIHKGSIYLKRNYINDTMAIISKENLDFLKSFNGENDCQALYSISGMSEDIFWDNLYRFWEKKIIVF